MFQAGCLPHGPNPNRKSRNSRGNQTYDNGRCRPFGVCGDWVHVGRSLALPSVKSLAWCGTSSPRTGSRCQVKMFLPGGWGFQKTSGPLLGHWEESLATCLSHSQLHSGKFIGPGSPNLAHAGRLRQFSWLGPMPQIELQLSKYACNPVGRGQWASSPCFLLKTLVSDSPMLDLNWTHLSSI